MLFKSSQTHPADTASGGVSFFKIKTLSRIDGSVPGNYIHKKSLTVSEALDYLLGDLDRAYPPHTRRSNLITNHSNSIKR